MGQDLAFTGNKDHADGVTQEKMDYFEKSIMVEDIYGNMIPTCRPFAMCREWMERRIAQPDATMPIYDATEGGAKIKGTRICKLADVFCGDKE